MTRRGFTLVELVVVISILAIMAAILVGILNPISLVNRGKDARRKKDLARIKISFEEYYNDKGCYPKQAKIDELATPTVCGDGDIFAPWLSPWLCDPDGDPYEIVVGGANADCPNTYRVYTTLYNIKDKDIPEDWGLTVLPHDTIDLSVNYGVSSPNASWYQEVGDFDCTDTDVFTGSCHFLGNSCSTGQCIWEYTTQCTGDDCYYAKSQACKTDCCVNGFQCSP